MNVAILLFEMMHGESVALFYIRDLHFVDPECREELCIGGDRATQQRDPPERHSGPSFGETEDRLGEA